MTATTALTAQDTLGVSGIHYVPSEFVVKQIDACINDIGVDVIKIGMLASASTVDAVADALEKYERSATVVDPVMVATSGAQLLPNEAVGNLVRKLLPLTTILTPNIPEAQLLLQNAGLEVPETSSLDNIVNIARLVQKLGPRYVLLKGGHLPLTLDGDISEDEASRHVVVDVLHDGYEAMIYETDYSPSQNTHGTGCSLACKLSLMPLFPYSTMAIPHARQITGISKQDLLPCFSPPSPSSYWQNNKLIPYIAAIACGIATSKSSDGTSDIPDAVHSAVEYVEVGIKTSSNLGQGSGPINHFHSLRSRQPPTTLSATLRVYKYLQVQDERGLMARTA